MSILPENKPTPDEVELGSSIETLGEPKQWWRDIPGVDPALEPEGFDYRSIGKAGLEDVEFSDDALKLYDLVELGGNPTDFVEWWAEGESIDLEKAATELNQYGLLESIEYTSYGNLEHPDGITRRYVRVVREDHETKQ